MGWKNLKEIKQEQEKENEKEKEEKSDAELMGTRSDGKERR